MLRDPELESLIEQADRNLRTLELLVLGGGSPELTDDLRQRIRRLRDEYVKETDALTREVLRRAVDRRAGAADRRRPHDPQPVGT